ncbi:MAG: hypothetical protein ACE5K0_12640 [Candidatus Methanofastidiosia archaeon]
MIHADWIEFENATSKNIIKVLKEVEHVAESVNGVIHAVNTEEDLDSMQTIWSFNEWRRERKNIWALQLEKKPQNL